MLHEYKKMKNAKTKYKTNEMVLKIDSRALNQIYIEIQVNKTNI